MPRVYSRTSLFTVLSFRRAAPHRHKYPQPRKREVDRRARLSEKRASDCGLKPFATLTPGKAWGSSPFGVRLAHYDSRLLQLCRSSDIHGTLDATKPRYASGAAPWLPKP